MPTYLVLVSWIFYRYFIPCYRLCVLSVVVFVVWKMFSLILLLFLLPFILCLKNSSLITMFWNCPPSFTSNNIIKGFVPFFFVLFLVFFFFLGEMEFILVYASRLQTWHGSQGNNNLRHLIASYLHWIMFTSPILINSETQIQRIMLPTMGWIFCTSINVIKCNQDNPHWYPQSLSSSR